VSRHQSLRWTWSELDAEVDSVASGLLRLGIGKGDRVGIWAPNRAEWAVIQFATARIGAILVTINPAYRTSEVEYALNKVGCRPLVLAPRFKSSDYVAMLRELGPQRLPMLAPWRRWVRRTSGLPAVGRAACGARQGRARRPIPAADRQRSDQHPVHQRHHRLSKGATPTHRNILNNGTSVRAPWGWASRTGCASPCRSTTAWHGAGSGRHQWRGDGLSRRGVRSAPRAGSVQRKGAPGCTACRPCSSACSPAGRRDYDVSTLRTGIMAGSPCPVR
jgi:fatty-acyl-CoA synthase